MDWSRWLIGVSKYDEQCRLCGSPIPAGETLAVEEAVMGTECVGCFWEYARSLTKKARPRARPKPKGAVMPWQKVGGGPAQDGGDLLPISKWEKGLVLEGQLVTRREGGMTQANGKKGLLIELDAKERGRVVYPLAAQLQYKLQTIRDGAKVRIECTGKEKLESGFSAWAFDVWVDE